MRHRTMPAIANPRFDEFMLAYPNMIPRIDMGRPQMGGVRKLQRLNTPKARDATARKIRFGFSGIGMLLSCCAVDGLGRCKNATAIGPRTAVMTEVQRAPARPSRVVSMVSDILRVLLFVDCDFTIKPHVARKYPIFMLLNTL